MLVTRSLARLSAALSFAYVLRATVLGVPTTALEICLVATLIAYVVEKRRAGEPFPDPRRLPYCWPVALLLVAATISVLVAPDRRAAAGIWKAYFVEPALIAYVLADALRARRDLEKLVAAFFFGAIAVAVLNILTFLFVLGTNPTGIVEHPPVMIYFTPNATGLFLGPLLAIAAALLFFGRGQERGRSAVFIAVALPAFVLSFSRGAWLGLLVALVFLALQTRRRWLAAGIVVAGGAASLLVPAVRRRVAHELSTNDPNNSVNSRVTLWKATFRMMAHGLHPVLGTGLSGFKAAMAAVKESTPYREDLIYPHNLYLDFWTETGLLGLAAFVWLSVEWVRRTVATVRAATDLRPYYLGLAAASVTILVHGLLDVPFFKNDLAFLTFALVGMQVAAMRRDGLAGPPPTGRSGAGVPATPPAPAPLAAAAAAASPAVAAAADPDSGA
ncbi:MAG TPA: O-antigen ligase family protein [Candidatus Dormibacteraeota bacterium]|nr:O-antigen ligase family protein [Candidatus Dormibacteraeota bacterium]